VNTKGLHEKFIHNVRLHKLLVKFDHDLARAARAQGCYCGGKLHSAHYPRKPKGVPANVREFYCERLSLCCAEDDCRERMTPPFVSRETRRRLPSALLGSLYWALEQARTRRPRSGMVGGPSHRVAAVTIIGPLSRATLRRQSDRATLVPLQEPVTAI
jgi:hypothetical protein